MAHDVFISYSSKDKTVADAVCARLESRGVRCWIAPRDVMPGSDYGASIIDAILGSKLMVLVLSGHANASKHVPHEIERAVSNGVTVLPFRIEDVRPAKSLDLFIGSVHWLDALTPPLERHLDELANKVSEFVHGQQKPGPQPIPGPSPRPTPVPEPPNYTRLAAVGGALVLVLAVGWFFGRGGSTQPAASLAGCWHWFNNATVVIDAGGTITAAPFTGQWRRTDGANYVFTWPEPVDTLTMSRDGRTLNGSNQYGAPVAATRTSGGPDFPGGWSWGGVAPVTVNANGTVALGALSGTWTLSDPARRVYRVTWPKIEDQVTLSDDGQRLTGGNQYGVRVSGTKMSSCG